MKRSRTQGTLCWECANAAPLVDGSRGCSWSEDFAPVPGWVAEPRVIGRHLERGRDSYFVHECPLYIKG